LSQTAIDADTLNVNKQCYVITVIYQPGQADSSTTASSPVGRLLPEHPSTPQWKRNAASLPASLSLPGLAASNKTCNNFPVKPKPSRAHESILANT
jgi:hypothetical protein